LKNICVGLCASLLATGLGLVAVPALAHEGHLLDLVSAFVAPLAGWDHLLMAGLIVGMVRAIAKAATRRARVRGSDDQ
jgi:hydrogenase/urease accessory protein HupE